jgi:hypothetical protein
MCFPVNDTAATLATPFPYASYAKKTNGNSSNNTTEGRDDEGRSGSFRDAMLDVWVASSTAHVFADDQGSSFCVDNNRVTQIDWAGAPSTTQAAQVAVRIPAGAASLQIAVQVSDLIMETTTSSTSPSSPPLSAPPSIPASMMSVRQVGFVYAAESALYMSERGSAWYPDMLVQVETVSNRGGGASGSGACPRTDSAYPCRTYTEVGSSSAGFGFRFSFELGGRQLSAVNVSNTNGVAECEKECDTFPECKGFTVVTTPSATLTPTTMCHTVNATNVVVDTALQSTSYRAHTSSITLFPSVTRSLWIDVHIPEGSNASIATAATTSAGNYSGQLSLIDPVSNTTVATVPVRLEVWPIAAECIHASSREFGKAWGFDSAVVDDAYQYTHNPTVSAADFERFMCDHHTPAESLASSWAAARPVEVVEKLLGSECNQRLFNAAFLGIDNQVPPENITAQFIKAALDAITPHITALSQSGLLPYAYVYAFDEAHIAYTDALRAYFGAVKQRWPSLKTLSVLPWVPSPDLPLDIWVVQYELLSIPDIRAGKEAFLAAGKEVWGYHCVGPEDPLNLNTFLDVPPAKGRLIPWLAQSEELSGWLYWYTNWGMRHSDSATDRGVNRTVPTPELDMYGRSTYVAAIGTPSDGHFSNEDGNLVYAGIEGPLSSQRLENLKMGMEDRALLGLLPHNVSVALAKRLAGGPADYSVDPALLEIVRREAARLVGVQTAEGCTGADLF